jgi:hypothetical protein
MSGHDLEVNQTPFLAAIGEAISLWASMEGILVQIAARLLGTTDRKAGLVLYSISFFAWLQIIEELFILEPKYSGDKAAWGVAANKLRRLNDIRTRLAHHTIWDYPDDDDIFLRPAQFDARSKSKKQQPLSLGDIRKFIDDLFDVQDDIIDIHIKMRTLS